MKIYTKSNSVNQLRYRLLRYMGRGAKFDFCYYLYFSSLL